MSIGERRHRVTFQRFSVAPDSYGEADKSWGDMCTSWALVQPLKGAERLSANQVMADLSYRIVTRNRSELSGLAPGDRAIWNSHTFDIKAVIFRDHRASELEILVQEHI